jgi:hypothetical protein
VRHRWKEVQLCRQKLVRRQQRTQLVESGEWHSPPNKKKD